MDSLLLAKISEIINSLTNFSTHITDSVQSITGITEMSLIHFLLLVAQHGGEAQHPVTGIHGAEKSPEEH